MRMVNQNAQVLVNGDDSYTVIFIQDGVTKTVQINGTSSSVITIKQNRMKKVIFTVFIILLLPLLFQLYPLQILKLQTLILLLKSMSQC